MSLFSAIIVTVIYRSLNLHNSLLHASIHSLIFENILTKQRSIIGHMSDQEHIDIELAQEHHPEDYFLDS
jgi:hypothetical protein